MRAGLIFLTFSAFFLTACAGGAPSDTPASAEADAASYENRDYRIGVDDLVQVTVWRNPDLSVTVPVRPDGQISVPLVGDVQAGGLTPEQVSSRITRRLERYIREPNVTVIVTELRSHEYLTRVRVTGAVVGPVSIPHRQGMTVLDAVLEAGGVNEFAAPGRTKVYRRRAGETRVIEVRLDQILHDGKLETNVELRPGDVVTVPERIF
ncbi:MAG: sugar ABC transporter substrate-binding protein [Gammaproteobacteria bacterium]|nr:sugar ABC transporter substrate-binding protein [Gammaproteobacteria bacterium]